MLYAGVGRTDLTPPLGAELQGYGWFLSRAAEGVNDAVQATALVIESDSQRAAIITCDLVGVPGWLTQTVRATAEQELGIPPENLLISATHTHHGPAVQDVNGCGEVHGGYLTTLPSRVIAALRSAAQQLEPVRLYRGVTQAPGVALNRVYGDEGPVDDRLWVAALRRLDSSPFAVLANFNCHAVTRSVWPALVSRDWPGVCSDQVEKALPGAHFLFLQGALGDINPVRMYKQSPNSTTWTGDQIAHAVTGVLDKLEESPSDDIHGALDTARLPLKVQSEAEVRAELADSLKPRDKPTAEEYHEACKKRLWACGKLEALRQPDPDILPASIQALRIGDLLLLGEPFELYTCFAVAARERSLLPHTWVVGCANDLLGYVAHPDDYEEQAASYAAQSAPAICGRFPFLPTAGDCLVDAMAALAASVTPD